MVMINKRLFCVATTLLIFCSIHTVQATVLTFDVPIVYSVNIDQGYGDAVTSTNDAIGSYQEGNGFTPHVTISYNTVGGSEGLYVYDTGYGDLINTVQANTIDGTAEITFTAESGYLIKINSFDLAAYYTDYIADIIEITDENGTIIWDAPFKHVEKDDGHSTFSPGISGTTLTIRWGNNWNIGIDNINFDESEKIIGDVNVDGRLDLTDAIVALKIVTNQINNNTNVQSDINQDGAVGLEEAIHALQIIMSQSHGGFYVVMDPTTGLIGSSATEDVFYSLYGDISENGDFQRIEKVVLFFSTGEYITHFFDENGRITQSKTENEQVVFDFSTPDKLTTVLTLEDGTIETTTIDFLGSQESHAHSKEITIQPPSNPLQLDPCPGSTQCNELPLQPLFLETEFEAKIKCDASAPRGGSLEYVFHKYDIYGQEDNTIRQRGGPLNIFPTRSVGEYDYYNFSYRTPTWIGTDVDSYQRWLCACHDVVCKINVVFEVGGLLNVPSSIKDALIGAGQKKIVEIFKLPTLSSVVLTLLDIDKECSMEKFSSDATKYYTKVVAKFQPDSGQENQHFLNEIVFNPVKQWQSSELSYEILGIIDANAKIKPGKNDEGDIGEVDHHIHYIVDDSYPIRKGFIDTCFNYKFELIDENGAVVKTWYNEPAEEDIKVPGVYKIKLTFLTQGSMDTDEVFIDLTGSFSITNPIDKSTITSNPTTFTYHYNSDNQVPIESVELYVNGILVDQPRNVYEIESIYEIYRVGSLLDLSRLSNGEHILKAIAHLQNGTIRKDEISFTTNCSITTIALAELNCQPPNNSYGYPEGPVNGDSLTLIDNGAYPGDGYLKGYIVTYNRDDGTTSVDTKFPGGGGYTRINYWYVSKTSNWFKFLNGLEACWPFTATKIETIDLEIHNGCNWSNNASIDVEHWDGTY